MGVEGVAPASSAVRWGKGRQRNAPVRKGGGIVAVGARGVRSSSSGCRGCRKKRAVVGRYRKRPSAAPPAFLLSRNGRDIHVRQRAMMNRRLTPVGRGMVLKESECCQTPRVLPATGDARVRR